MLATIFTQLNKLHPKKRASELQQAGSEFGPMNLMKKPLLLLPALDEKFAAQANNKHLLGWILFVEPFRYGRSKCASWCKQRPILDFYRHFNK
jgi:hypothetical protein